MPHVSHDRLSRLLDCIVDHIDVPKSYYDKAAARHQSLGEWLHRKESTLAMYSPDVRPQGSFRYGTVVRPLNPNDSYDLDNVCYLRDLGKTALTQRQLKEMYGAEIKAYARAHNMTDDPTEHNRCWRLNYSDEVNFHLDSLPCVPEDPAFIQRLIMANVPPDLASRAVAITDRRNASYNALTNNWPSSNPRGFAKWFEYCTERGRVNGYPATGTRAAVEKVPPYEWKTALQRCIQILKRHRDVMFQKSPDIAPISMIITNLAAQAYDGETDILVALKNILAKMPNHVQQVPPFVPNPADPAEDYADKWRTSPRLARSFWEWHTAAVTDIERLQSALERHTLRAEVKAAFVIDLTDDELRMFESPRPTSIGKVAPTILLPTAPKPWGLHA